MLLDTLDKDSLLSVIKLLIHDLERAKEQVTSLNSSVSYLDNKLTEERRECIHTQMKNRTYRNCLDDIDELGLIPDTTKQEILEMVKKVLIDD